MALEDVKDRIRERLTELWSRIQELPAYNNLQEKYETLSPTAQRGIKVGGIVVVAVVLISVPFSYFSSSATSDADYESKRQLIRGLLRASRLANEASSLPPPVSSEDFKTQLQNDLAEFNLLPEQLAGIDDFNPDNLGGATAPNSITQQGLSVNMKKLNLKQVVEIGYRLQGKNASVKMIGMDVRASAPDPHYFDVIYQLVIYSLPFSGADSDTGPDDSDAKAPQLPGKAPGGTGKDKPRSGGAASPRASKTGSGSSTKPPRFSPPGGKRGEDE